MIVMLKRWFKVIVLTRFIYECDFALDFGFYGEGKHYNSRREIERRATVQSVVQVTGSRRQSTLLHIGSTNKIN